MLTHLDIRNLALVDRAELELGPGMSVLTGETGAGKSMLLDAVGLAIGERASASVVGTSGGANGGRAEVTAVFDIAPGSAAHAWLAERELNHDDDCILRRTVAADGRSRAFINDRPVPAQTLRELGELLVDIHGQHAHQSLLRRDTQRKILDAHGKHQALLDEVTALHGQWRAVRAALEDDSGHDGDAESRVDFLQFQIDELESHQSALDNLSELLDDHRRLGHAADIESACALSLEYLDSDGGASGGSVRTLLGETLRALEAARRYDSRLEEPIALLSEASAQVQEATGALSRQLADMDTDRDRLARIDKTIAVLHDLGRKHRVAVEELPQTLVRLQAELQFLASRAERRAQLEAQILATGTRYREAAARLHQARQVAAKSLAKALQVQIRDLGMETGRARVAVESAPDAAPSAHGLDRVEFEFSANAGTELRALAQVASGGELSRVGLAIQVIATGQNPIGTLIFDEVDAGIGGRLADMVGARLRSLGETHQVLCVTHLPQVASHAAGHLRVSKSAKAGKTRTSVEALEGTARVEELARMLGGAEITDRTIAHARELLER